MPRPALLMAIAAFVFAALPIVGPEPTGLRLATSAVFALIGVLIARYALQRESLTVALSSGASGARKHVVPYERIAAVRLCEAPAVEQDPLPQRYAAQLVLKDGSRATFSVGANPADVLRDLHELTKRVDCPVELGWGLHTHGAPWLFEPSAPADAAVTSQRGVIGTRSVIHPKQRALAWVVLVLAGLTALDWLLLSLGQVRRGLDIQAVSVWLGVGAFLVMIVLAAALWSGEQRLRLAERLTVEIRHLGIAIQRRSCSVASIRDVHVVSPSGKGAQHLLFDTHEGPLAYPCFPSLGADSAARLRDRVIAQLSH